MLYCSAPRQALGTSNPLIAGGLRATMNEYARVLQLEFNRGTYAGNRLLDDSLEVDDLQTGVARFSVELAQQLEPLIRDAL